MVQKLFILTNSRVLLELNRPALLCVHLLVRICGSCHCLGSVSYQLHFTKIRDSFQGFYGILQPLQTWKRRSVPFTDDIHNSVQGTGT